MKEGYLKKQDKDYFLRCEDALMKTLTSLKGKNREVFSEVLPAFQEEVIRLGEGLEQTGLPVEKEVKVLEQICEEVYLLLTETGREEELFSSMERELSAFREELTRLPAKKLILFLPYKSSMWDSMESIYLACGKEEGMECRVMPIPWFSKSEEGSGLAMHIDKDFPPEIPLTDCKTYDLSLAKPDAVFIHNPYDNSNLVTSVHPLFYSDELKKHTACLIYVPYYTENHGLTLNQSNLPVYRNMDWFISPSEEHKESMKNLYFYGKVVALGSAKLDKAVRLSIEPPALPVSWGTVPEGKKRIMLDTTIDYVLSDTNTALSTLRQVFALVKERDDLLLVWRPHPLLPDTFRSLRPEDYPEWKELCREFRENGTGIFDETGDAAAAVSLCDGEIDTGSSIRHLAAAAEKPVYPLPRGDFDPAKLKEFLDGLAAGNLKEEAIRAKENLSAFAGSCDGHNGERIAAWLKKTLGCV